GIGSGVAVRGNDGLPLDAAAAREAAGGTGSSARGSGAARGGVGWAARRGSTAQREVGGAAVRRGSAGGRAVGAQEGGDAGGDDAVGFGVAELDGPHHGRVVDLAERQRGQVLGGQRGIIGVEASGSGQLGQGFGDYGHDSPVVPEVKDRGEVRRLGDDQPDEGGAFGGPANGLDDLADARGQRLLHAIDVAEVAVDDVPDAVAHDVVRVAQHLQEQVLLVAVVAVDGALRHPGLGGDRVDTGALVAVTREQYERSRADRVVLALPAGDGDVLHDYYCTTPFSLLK